MKPPAFIPVVVVVVVALVGVGCDLRPVLAQADLGDFRPELIDECCACLAARGTGHPEATCSEAALVDGAIAPPASAVLGSGNQAQDDNNSVDDGEIPCLCAGNAATCATTLNGGGSVVVPGACLAQIDRTAPCESACAAIINFEPVR